jgi:hypothetical protein
MNPPKRLNRRVEPYGELFVIVDDAGKRRFFAFTRAVAEEALAYGQAQKAAGLKPNWFLPRRAIDP